jgi:hypothetical protein
VLGRNQTSQTYYCNTVDPCTPLRAHPLPTTCPTSPQTSTATPCPLCAESRRSRGGEVAAGHLILPLLPLSPCDTNAPPMSPHHPAARANTSSAIPATGASRRPRHGHAETMPAPTLATTAPGLLSLLKPSPTCFGDTHRSREPPRHHLSPHLPLGSRSRRRRRGSERGRRHRVRPPLEERTTGGGRGEARRPFLLSTIKVSFPFAAHRRRRVLYRAPVRLDPVARGRRTYRFVFIFFFLLSPVASLAGPAWQLSSVRPISSL